VTNDIDIYWVYWYIQFAVAYMTAWPYCSAPVYVYIYLHTLYFYLHSFRTLFYVSSLYFLNNLRYFSLYFLKLSQIFSSLALFSLVTVLLIPRSGSVLVNLVSTD
jgi:hypothetical protein